MTIKETKTIRLLRKLIETRAGDYSYPELTKLARTHREQDTKAMINTLVKKGFIRVSNCRCMTKKDVYIKITLAGNVYISNFWKNVRLKKG